MSIDRAGGGWYAAELDDGRWRREIPAGAWGEALEAAAALQDRDLASIEPEQIPLRELAPALQGIARELTPGAGHGFVVARGFPVEGIPPPVVERLFFAIGLHFGVPIVQSRALDLLAHVRNDVQNPVRGYTHAGERFHSDLPEIAALLCIRAAARGGRSRVASLATAHDLLLETRPDLLEECYRPMYHGRINEQEPSEQPYGIQPIFARAGERWGGFYNRGVIAMAQDCPEVPRLTARQVEAFDLLDALIERSDVQFVFDLAPGDVLFTNNNMVVHARTAFEDDEDPELIRHLLRLWIDVPAERSLVPPQVRFDFRFGKIGMTPAQLRAVCMRRTERDVSGSAG
jgi:hypothetical protein